MKRAAVVTRPIALLALLACAPPQPDSSAAVVAAAIDRVAAACPPYDAQIALTVDPAGRVQMEGRCRPLDKIGTSPKVRRAPASSTASTPKAAPLQAVDGPPGPKVAATEGP